MSSILNWADVLLVGPFMIVMSFAPYPILLRAVGGGLIVINLLYLAIWNEFFQKKNPDSQPSVGPSYGFSIGQSKIEYFKVPRTGGQFPNAVRSLY
jgi:hypothetical protein